MPCCAALAGVSHQSEDAVTDREGGSTKERDVKSETVRREKAESLKEREMNVVVKCHVSLVSWCGHEFPRAPDGEILSTSFRGDWLDISGSLFPGKCI